MPAASAIKVMVVDDQTIMRVIVRRTLKDLGISDVRDKPGAAEALQAMKSDRVHLIISDYNMPEMDGLQLLDAVRNDPVIRNTAFIMLTGSANRELVEKAAAMGVNNFVMKPFAPAALKEKIERVFGELT